VERKITPYTKAIIPVHMCGLPCAMDALAAIARPRGIRILEDACQADGGAYKGVRLGTLGDAGAYSFNHFKIISAGEGGAMVTRDVALYERALIQHDCGCVFFRGDGKPLHAPFFAGMNFRISELLSAVIRVQLTRLDGILAALRERKRIMVDAMRESSACSPAPINDREGDCGVICALRFDSESRMRAWIAAARAEEIEAVTPIDSGRHVYTNWTPILEKRGAHHPLRDPYASARRSIDYAPDMCAATLDILKRTAFVAPHPGVSLDDTRRMADRMRQC
jgi:dTDP-4-amino-4,6-dideoxygalactose transaminase